LTGRHKLSLLRQGDPAFIGVLALVAVVMISALGAAAMMVDGNSGSRPPAAAGLQGAGSPTPSPARSTVASPSPTRAPEAATSPTMVLPVSPPPARTPGPPASSAPVAPVVRSYEAESANNTLAGGAVVGACAPCSGGADVRGLGNTGTVQFNGVTVGRAGSITVTVYYVNGDPGNRLALLGVGSTYAVWVSFPSTRNWQTVGSVAVTLPLQSGANELLVLNNFAAAPDLDRITVRDPGA
jgi:alpha-galactosidase-like CBM13-containing protein